jgi:hypothetical protein
MDKQTFLKTRKLAVHHQKPRDWINRNQNVDEQKPGFGRSGNQKPRDWINRNQNVDEQKPGSGRSDRRFLCYHQSGIRKSNCTECDYSGNRNVDYQSKEAEKGRTRNVD